MANDEFLRRVIAEVLTEVRGQGTPARGAVTTTPRGAQLPMLPQGAQPPVDYCAACIEQERSRGIKRAVITTTGNNGKGIVAKITQTIADAGGDILDISQTLVSNYFTMIIVCDVGSLETTFEQFKQSVTETAAGLGIQTMMMHEDVMSALHRV